MRTALRRSLLVAAALPACWISACAPEDGEPLQIGTASLALCDFEANDSCLDLDGERPDPGRLDLTGRSASSLTISYVAHSDWTSHQVERRLAGSTEWSVIKSYGAVETGTRSYTNGGLSSDTAYCYRVRAKKGSYFGYGWGPCGLTRAANGANPEVRRLQLRVKVADKADAGTSDPIDVTLSEYALPGVNRTGLNYSATPQLGVYPNPTTWVDDFARNTERTYDLNVSNIRTLRDISKIQIEKHAKFGDTGGGSDAVCIEAFDLLVNGAPVYGRNFGANCRWLDGDAGYAPSFLVSFEQLRSAPSFIGFDSPPVQFELSGAAPSYLMPRAELHSRIESLIGDVIWNDGKVVSGPAGLSTTVTYDWDRVIDLGAVELSRPLGFGWRAVRVDLDLKGRATTLPDAAIDIDFDIVISFPRNDADDGFNVAWEVTGFEAKADLAWWADQLIAFFCGITNFTSGSCVSRVERMIEEEIESSVVFPQNVLPFLSDDDLAALGCTQPTVMVTADVSLRFSCQ